MGEPRNSVEFSRLAIIAKNLQTEYEQLVDEWADSPFSWIKEKNSRSRGAIGEKLIHQWCVDKGLSVLRSPDSEADRIIEGKRVEIKFSTLWQNGKYRFQQIRDQNYSYLFCLGLSPQEAHAWLIPKPILREYVIGQMGQHKGRQASDTDWLEVNPKLPLNWLAPYGSSLADVSSLLKDIK